MVYLFRPNAIIIIYQLDLQHRLIITKTSLKFFILFFFY